MTESIVATTGASLTPASVTLIASLILLRALVAFHPFSGEGDDHGGDAAYGGDYEAQRHWMEITLHLPVSEWYWHDLHYWGLDYPPLTAYVSLICGWLSSLLSGPESVALYESRGYETVGHKSFMRASVLVLDVGVYFTAVWFLAGRLCREGGAGRRWWCVGLALSQPAIILIDHGHFQYNTVALGFSLWSVYYIAKPDFFPNCIIGSVLFCLALNFKQMTLYYAPVIFAYLLGRCSQKNNESTNFVVRFMSLGVTVVTTFAALWWPLAVYSPPNVSAAQALLQVLKRIFPLQRGLFENKVANVWFALSRKPFKILDRIPAERQPLLALVVTLILIMPVCIKLFRVGQQSSRHRGDDSIVLLWGAGISALGFFLGSFQVHEKSILLALAPFTLLLTRGIGRMEWQPDGFVIWFSVLSSWSLWPLLKVDKLEMAYFAVMVLYSCVCYNCAKFRVGKCSGARDSSTNGIMRLFTSKLVIPSSCLLMICLHVIELLVYAPSSLPDLYAVLWSCVGCGFFCWAWLYGTWFLCWGDGYSGQGNNTHADNKLC